MWPERHSCASPSQVPSARLARVPEHARLFAINPHFLKGGGRVRSPPPRTDSSSPPAACPPRAQQRPCAPTPVRPQGAFHVRLSWCSHPGRSESRLGTSLPSSHPGSDTEFGVLRAFLAGTLESRPGGHPRTPPHLVQLLKRSSRGFLCVWSRPRPVACARGWTTFRTSPGSARQLPALRTHSRLCAGCVRQAKAASGYFQGALRDAQLSVER